MNEENPENIWKKPLTGGRGLGLWFITLFTATFALLFCLGYISAKKISFAELAPFAALGGFSCALFLTALIALLRWVFCWHNFKCFLFSLICLGMLFALLYAEENWRGQHAWETFKRAEKTKDEKLDFKDFIPPSVPDDQNFALTPVVATSYNYLLTQHGEKISHNQADPTLVNRLAFDLGDADLETNGLGHWARGTLSDLKPWQKLYRQLATKTNLFAIPSRPQLPAVDVLLALRKYDSTVEELRQASRLPESRFPLNYNAENPATILLPDLSSMKSSVRLLQLRALAELQSGQGEKALADIKLMFRLTEAIRTEPFLISDLVRIAMTETLLQPLYEGLARHQWTDTQLVGLDAELAKLDFLADYQFVMRGERACDCKIIDYIGEKDRFKRYNEFTTMMSSADTTQLSKWFLRAGLTVMPSGWFDQNKLYLARIEQFWITGSVAPEAHLVSPQKFREADKAFWEFTSRPARPWNFLPNKFIPALGAAGRKSAYEQSAVDLARTAIALERYRLALGEFPHSLDVLAPKFIPEVPHDVINGEPLNYRRAANGQFTLYSVGWNETDDGGVVVMKKDSSSVVDIEQGDWVWRYPENK